MERSSKTLALHNRLIPLIFVLAAVVGFWPTLLGLFDRWLQFDESYSHGFLVLLISSFLCFSTWRRVKPVSGVYWPWLIPLVIFVLVYLVGHILLIEAFQQVMLVPIIFAGLLSLWGWRQALPFVIPVGLLVFALPFWDYASWPLQLITVAVNQFMLSWLDIEFVVEGVFVYFPGVGAFEIAHGCSGLRYLLVGVTLSLLYGELNLRTWQYRIGLVLTSVLFALFANWIRVFIIIYVGYESNMTSSLIEEHDFFGWWVFGATLIPLYFIARWFENTEFKKHPASLVDDLNCAAKTSSPVSYVLIFVPVLLLVAVSYLSGASSIEGGQPGRSFSPGLALMDSEQWMPLFRRDLSGWSPTIIQPDRKAESTYTWRGGLNSHGSSDMGVFIGLYTYEAQRPGREVVQYHNRLYDSSYQLPERTFEVISGNDIILSGLSLRYRQSQEHLHVAYGYYVEGRWERNELQAKLAQLPGIFNSRSDASLLVIGLNCEECDAQEVLSNLSSDIRPAVQHYLDGQYSIN